LSAELRRPDLNIYIDISPEASMKRLNSDRDSIELYETVENLHNVRAKYKEAFELTKFKDNVFTINGDSAPHVVAAEIWNEVSQMTVAAKSH
jgi:dTMP kinase